MKQLAGSCHCGAIAFTFSTHAPVPFMRCYCTICRKTSGGGGYTINMLGQYPTLNITKGKDLLKSYRAVKDKSVPKDQQVLCQDRFFCPTCASYLYAYDERWPEWFYPYASCIDSELPKPEKPASIMIESAAKWAVPEHGEMYAEYPPFSLEEWHKSNGQYVE